MMTVSVADARARFSQLVEAASMTHERVEVTRNGSRAAVLLGAEDFDALIETVDILSDAQLVADLRRALGELEREETVSVDEVADAMRKAGRRVR